MFKINYFQLLFCVYTGWTNGQVEDFSCGPFCLAGQSTCTCTVTGQILIWTLTKMDGMEAGQVTLFPNNLHTSKPVVGVPAFQAFLNNTTSETLTATLSFITMSEFQGYRISCATNGFTDSEIIDVKGTSLFLQVTCTLC